MKNRSGYEINDPQMTSFREDLARRLSDPEFEREFREARERASLGLKIARVRTARGMSQAQLAAKLNTTQSVVSRFESADYSGHKVETLRRVAEALDLDLVLDLRQRETE
jgi:ribosome-binding protein aMBF1 (putative translation factor)